MAQLPPKIPTISQNWTSFPHQRMSTMASFIPTTTANTTQQYEQQQQQQHQRQNSPPQQLPTWVDEFLDYSSARRGAHRRSASDSVAFLETAFLDECRNSGTMMMMPGGTHHGFDRLDDDQLMSMFSDEVGSVALPPSSTTGSLSNPSTPSDQNSNNDEKPMAVDFVPIQDHQQQQHPKIEPGEVESSFKNESDTPPPPPSSTPAGGEHIVDPKRVKRILANRQSAQRSRVRKLQYISELERSVTSLQTEVSALSPRVAFLDHQRLILNVDNSALKQRIAALAQDKIFKDAHQEALKREIERLRQIYHQQNLQKMEKSMNNNGNGHSLHSLSPSSQPQPPVMPPHSHPQQLKASQSLGCTDKEHLLG